MHFHDFFITKNKKQKTFYTLFTQIFLTNCFKNTGYFKLYKKKNLVKSRGANDGCWNLTIFFKEKDYLDLHQSYFFVLFSERRAHSNLGNAHIFLGEFERAADHYKRTLLLAQDLGDRAVEAQACYRSKNLKTNLSCLLLFQKTDNYLPNSALAPTESNQKYKGILLH